MGMSERRQPFRRKMSSEAYPSRRCALLRAEPLAARDSQAGYKTAFRLTRQAPSGSSPISRSNGLNHRHKLLADSHALHLGRDKNRAHDIAIEARGAHNGLDMTGHENLPRLQEAQHGFSGKTPHHACDHCGGIILCIADPNSALI